MTQKTKFFLTYCFFILAVLFRCSAYNPTNPVHEVIPEISNLLAPSVVFSQSAVKHAISVQVKDPQGVEDLADVRFEITKLGSNTAVASGSLLDDGTTGDIIPGDGRFTSQIQGSTFQNDTGEFDLEVWATDIDQNVSSKLEAKIFVLSGTENNLPEILDVTAPSTVTIDSSAFDFLVAVEVSDGDGLDDIEYVVSQFYPPAHPNPTRLDTLLDNGLSGDVTFGDGIYSRTFRSRLIREASDYFMRFQAEDKSGNRSRPAVITIRGVFSQPGPPAISNLVAPDTVKIDPNQVVKILITIEVTDPQGLSDIDFVRFRSFLPDGSEAQNSPFELSDDGNAAVTGDADAADGIYSIIINLPPTGVTPGDFRFVFQARDKSGLESNTIEHIMTVIE